MGDTVSLVSSPFSIIDRCTSGASTEPDVSIIPDREDFFRCPSPSLLDFLRNILNIELKDRLSFFFSPKAAIAAGRELEPDDSGSSADTVLALPTLSRPPELVVAGVPAAARSREDFRPSDDECCDLAHMIVRDNFMLMISIHCRYYAIVHVSRKTAYISATYQ